MTPRTSSKNAKQAEETALQNDPRLYVEKVLALYLGLPGTPSRTSRYDRRLAYEFFKQEIPLETVEMALLLGSGRRLFRDPSYPPLGPIRSLHYFLPVIDEVLATKPPASYLHYLRRKLALHAARSQGPQ